MLSKRLELSDIDEFFDFDQDHIHVNAFQLRLREFLENKISEVMAVEFL